MEKITLNDITFLMTVRFDSIERLENALSVVSFLYDHFNTKIKILEVSTYNNHIFSALIGDKADYYFFEDNDLMFNKKKYIDILVKMANTPYISVWDTDVIVDINQIMDALNRLRKNEVDMAYPYDGQLLDTSEPIRDLFLKNFCIDTLLRYQNYMNPLQSDTISGVMLISTKKYRSAGMDNKDMNDSNNSIFKNYACLQQLGLSVYRSNGCLYHLSHPNQLSSKENNHHVSRYLSKPDLDYNRATFNLPVSIENFQAYRIDLPCEIKPQQIEINGAVTVNIKHANSFTDLSVNTLSYKQFYGFELSPSEILNFSTHRSIWQQFYASKSLWCLVVESNVCMKQSVENFLDTIERLPYDWDVFIPYDKRDIKSLSQKKSHGKALQNENVWEHDHPEPYLLSYKLGNSIYFISRQGAEKLLRIETITDRLDHIFLTHRDLNVYMEKVKWFDIDSIVNYEWKDRNQLILKSAIEKCGWSEERLTNARKLLNTISDIGISHQLNLMIDAGTLLAYVRHRGIILWDDDFDIGIEEIFLPVFFNEIKKHPNLRYDQFVFFGTRYFKVWDISGEAIENRTYTFPFVDIWPYIVRGSAIVYENRNVYINAAHHPSKSIIFEGASFHIPWNPLEILDSRYSDWRNTIRVYSYSHRMERSNHKYLCIPIQTNEEGKYIDVL